MALDLSLALMSKIAQKSHKVLCYTTYQEAYHAV